MGADMENYVGGTPVVVLATDGTKLYGVLSDTDGHLQVDVKSGGGTPDGATETTLDAIKTAAEIIDGFANPNNVLFGYYDRYFEQGNDDSPAAGTREKDLSPVDSGEIWVIQGIMGQNSARAARISLQFVVNSSWTKVREYTSGGAGHPVTVSGQWVLKEGDLIRITFFGTVQNDSLRWRAWGYKMKV